MNSPTSTPHQPSMASPVKWPVTVAMSTTVVAMVSLRESVAVASMAEESSRFPSFLLYRNI